MPYYVYMLASKKNGVLYIGVTNDLVRRVYEHRTHAVKSFTSRYNVDALVWFDIYDDPLTAITREGTQEVAARVEGRAHRSRQSRVA